MAALEMNPEIRARWTAALRSGEYQQGRQTLATSDGKYCCLGVLCDLAVKDGVIPAAVPHPVIEGELAFAGSCDYLPSMVTEWAGLADGSPVVAGPGRDPAGEPLAFLNDNGSSFAEIADLIDGIEAAA